MAIRELQDDQSPYHLHREPEFFSVELQLTLPPAPKLQKFHGKHPEVESVMISMESPEENRAKVNEHGLTFTVVLQKQREVSRQYAYFATPVAYLINGAGVITADVAVGVDAITDLMKRTG